MRVALTPVGHARADVVDDATFERERAHHRDREALLEERRAEVRAGWGEKYVARVHEKKKLTTRERIELLKDDAAPALEVGTFVNYGEEFGELKSPAAGVVTVFTQVHGRWCMVIANDNTVASGAWWPRTPEKIQRAQEMARRLRLPTLYLVDCSGLFLPEQRRSFSGLRGAGHIFKMNSLLSAEGVPQIAGVFGDCIAGGGYMPIISDRVYMTEQAYMVIAGAALIKGAKSQKITSLDIGGPEVHVHQSACADVRVPDDETLIACLRRDVERLPTSAIDFYRGDAAPIEPAHSPNELTGIVPVDHRQAYEAQEVLARVCDQSLFCEVMPHVGREMICGVARIRGLYAGIIINRQGLIPDADRPGEMRPGGILYRQGIAKISTFSRACNSDGIPIVWLQDIAGFDIGAEAERQGLLAYGSNLIYTNSTNTTPMFTVLLRKTSGAGYYAMAGLPYDPVVQLSTPVSRLSVMEGRTVAIATYNSRLDDEFNIETTDPAERAKIEESMKRVEARIEADMDPYVAARQGDTDEIIRFDELRDWLSALLEMSYQGYGYRRVKNPRIWSLHDLAVLTEASEHVALEMQDAVTGAGDATGDDAFEEPDADFVVRAPMSGRFYARPSPDEAAFVNEGDTVDAGATVGLLEVMKTFNRLTYGGDGAPAKGTVSSVLVGDGDDVRRGQPILAIDEA